MAELHFHPDRACQSLGELAGRAREIRHVLQYLTADDMQSVSIVGAHGMGKSSLLKVLATPGNLGERFPGVPEDLLAVYVDSQALGLDTPEDFFEALAPYFSDTLHMPLRNATDFARLPDELLRSRRRLVLLFDDFHMLTLNPKFPASFFMLIRSQVSTCANLCCVTSSHLPLQRLCATIELVSSPFFNIFNLLNVGPLDTEAAKVLVQSRLPGDADRAHAIAVRVVKVVGRHPLLLHRVGQSVVDQGGVDLAASELDALLDTAYEDLREAYRGFIEPIEERTVSTLEAAMSSRTLRPEHLDQSLVNLGVVELDGDRVHFSSENSERCSREVLNKPRRVPFWRRWFGGR